MIAEKLLETLKTKQYNAQQRYAHLAERVARGESVSDDEALAILSAAGKSAEQLEKHARRLHRIAEIKPLLADVDKLNAEFNAYSVEHLAELERLKAERDRAEEACRLSAADFDAKHWAYRQRMEEIGKLQLELQQLTTPPPDDPGFIVEGRVDGQLDGPWKPA